MNVPLSKLNYIFTTKPLLVGGMAMEYYGLRKSGKDIDLLADEQDIVELIKMYPDRVKDLYSDLGVCPYDFEIWRTIGMYSYSELIDGAIDEGDYLVISLEKLLLMKVMAMHKEKYLEDTKLIVKKMIDMQYQKYEEEKKRVSMLLKEIPSIHYIEKTGPT